MKTKPSWIALHFITPFHYLASQPFSRVKPAKIATQRLFPLHKCFIKLATDPLFFKPSDNDGNSSLWWWHQMQNSNRDSAENIFLINFKSLLHAVALISSAQVEQLFRQKGGGKSTQERISRCCFRWSRRGAGSAAAGMGKVFPSVTFTCFGLHVAPRNRFGVNFYAQTCLNLLT